MTEPHVQASLRGLPPMDSLLDQIWLEEWIPSLGRETVKRVFTSVVNDIREGIRNGSVENTSMEAINRRAASVFARRGRSSLRSLVNATGVAFSPAFYVIGIAVLTLIVMAITKVPETRGWRK